MQEFLNGLPLWYAKIGAIIIFLIVLAAAWLLPKNFIFNGAPNNKRWRDLRLWATILVAFQLIIYTFF